jgi:hypothetical protein
LQNQIDDSVAKQTVKPAQPAAVASMGSSRRLGTAVVVAAAVAAVAVLIAMPAHPELTFDANYYAAFAHTAPYPGATPRPFSWRLLGPSIVRILSPWLGTRTSFAALALASMLVLGIGVTVLAQRSVRYPLAIAAILLLPFEIQSLPTYYLPDLLNAALLAMFILAVASETDLVASILLLFLFLSRESTILVAAVTVVIAIGAHRRTLAIGTIAATLVGVGITHHFAALGPPNVHGWPDFFYLALKIAYHALRNLGIMIAVPNGAQPCRPEWILTLPGALRTNYLSQLGVCRWDPSQPVTTMTAWLTGFGAGPAVAICCALRFRREILRAPAWTLVAAAYGVLAFVSGPFTGAWVDRLVGYGWPLFLIAIPYLLERVWNWEPAAVATLLGCHAALLAINFAVPPLFARILHEERAPLGALLDVAALMIQLGAFRAVARQAFDRSRTALSARN